MSVHFCELDTRKECIATLYNIKTWILREGRRKVSPLIKMVKKSKAYSIRRADKHMIQNLAL